MVTEKETLNNAIKIYGKASQIEMIIEECSELIQAIQKFKRNDCKETRDHVCEEVADVLIMMEQAKRIFNAKRVEEFREMKILRLANRLNS